MVPELNGSNGEKPAQLFKTYTWDYRTFRKPTNQQQSLRVTGLNKSELTWKRSQQQNTSIIRNSGKAELPSYLPALFSWKSLDAH